MWWSWFVGLLLLAVASWPLWQAWIRNRATPLYLAVACGSLTTWTWGGLVGLLITEILGNWRDTCCYLALCLTACTVVAILGARRPIIAAWPGVLAGFFVVLLLPLADVVLTGQPRYEGVGLTLLAGTLLMGTLNYLPTCFWPAALLGGLGCGLELLGLFVLADQERVLLVGSLCLALTPLLGALAWARRWPGTSELDRLWLDFRDRFGLIWGQRLREMFDTAAANADFPVHLSWGGLRLNEGVNQVEDATNQHLLEILSALLKRFGPADGN